jgi:hypothetical protein
VKRLKIRENLLTRKNSHGSPYQPGGSTEGGHLRENGQEFNPARFKNVY